MNKKKKYLLISGFLAVVIVGYAFASSAKFGAIYNPQKSTTGSYDPLGQATSTLASHTTAFNHNLFVNQAYGSSTYALLSSNYINQAYASTTYTTAASSTATYVKRADWTTIDNYPSACSGGQYVSAIGDTLTCATPAGGGGNNSGEVGALAYYAVAGTTATGTDPTKIYWDSTNGRLGIGTTTPNNLLQVYEYIDFNSTDYNTKLGYFAGKYIVSGAAQSVYIGYQAGSANNSTGKTNAADRNTAIGYQALYQNTSGSDNITVGGESLYKNTSGAYNTAFGKDALYNNTTGANNVALGYGSLYNNGTGSGKIGLGYYSGNYDNATNTSSFYVNNRNLTNTASEKAYSLLYGTFATGASISGQQLTINGLLGISTTTPTTQLQIVNPTAAATSTFAVGSAFNSKPGVSCLWNGASYTILSFASNSITPIYATSTTCN